MEKTGLVLSGGGGKGAFQVGALKALEEAGMLDFVTAVSGASIGTLNACMFVEHRLDQMEKVWKSINPSMFLEPDIEDIADITGEALFDRDSIIKRVVDKYQTALNEKKYELFSRSREGAFSTDGIRKILDENVDFEKVSSASVEFYTDVCYCHDDILELEYIKLNNKPVSDIKTLVRAACALPFVYDSVEYQGKVYRDGGILDNVPIKPLYDAGYRNIIVIGLKRDYGIDYSVYKDCKFTIIMPSHSIGEFMDGTLDFTANGAKFRMALGYRNAARIAQAVKSGKIHEPDYQEWLAQMSELDYEAAKTDVRQEKLFDKKDEHMDKLLSIYNKYM